MEHRDHTWKDNLDNRDYEPDIEITRKMKITDFWGVITLVT
jgi:hypothetical protein